MSLSQELARFDTVIAELFPQEHSSLHPGLDDTGIDVLRQAVAPLGLSADLEALYRWHDGFDLLVLGGKQMLSAAQIIKDHEFHIDILDHPPAWLQFTDGPEFLFVSLDVPGCDPDHSVWAGNTHDVWINRMHDSLGSMIASFNDMGTDPRESPTRRRELLLGALRNGGDYRLNRSPLAYRHPNAPVGTSIVKFEDGTPEPWLRSVGTSAEGLLPRGATTTIAKLVEATTRGEVSGTVQGRTANVAGPIRAIGFTIDDRTGSIRLVADNAATTLGPVSGTWVEADVTMFRDGSCRLTALRRSPDWVE